MAIGTALGFSDLGTIALAVAGAVALAINRWLIARGKGHTAVHETGIHNGPPVRVVATVAVVAFVFGVAVLVAEAIGEDDGGHRAAMTLPRGA